MGRDPTRKSSWYIRVAGRKQYYATQAERDTAYANKQAETEAFGFGPALDLSAQDRLAIAEMRREATRVGLEPMEIFRRGLTLVHAGPKITVPDAVVGYLKHCEQRIKDGTMRRPTVRDLDTRLTGFAAHVGNIAVQSVTREMVDAWAGLDNPAANSRSNRVARVSMLFGWLIDSNVLKENPCKRPRVARRTPAVFETKAVAKLLRKAAAMHPGLVPMMALQWFAGIRPAASQRLDWQNIDFTRQRIVIPPEISKSTEPEIVDRLPATIWAWLRPWRKKSGRIAPGKHPLYYQEVKHACGINDWPTDVARHTFASHLYGLTGSIEEVGRALLHHTTRITLKHYVAKGLTPAQGRTFFALRPGRAHRAAAQQPRHHP